MVTITFGVERNRTNINLLGAGQNNGPYGNGNNQSGSLFFSGGTGVSPVSGTFWGDGSQTPLNKLAKHRRDDLSIV